MTTASVGARSARAIAPAATPMITRVRDERPPLAERGGRDERREQRRREEGNDVLRSRPGSGRPPSRTGPAASMAIVPTPTARTTSQTLGHARHHPMSAASAAAMICTPGGVNGVRAMAMAAPRSAATTALPGAAELPDEEREEQRREGGIEPECRGIAKRLASDDPDHRARPPRRATGQCRPP